MENLCAEQQAHIAARSKRFLLECIERNRPANTRGAYDREKRKWEAYLQREGITSLPAKVTSYTLAVLASYLTERLNIASSGREPSVNPFSSTPKRFSPAYLRRRAGPVHGGGAG